MSEVVADDRVAKAPNQVSASEMAIGFAIKAMRKSPACPLGMTDRALCELAKSALAEGLDALAKAMGRPGSVIAEEIRAASPPPTARVMWWELTPPEDRKPGTHWEQSADYPLLSRTETEQGYRYKVGDVECADVPAAGAEMRRQGVLAGYANQDAGCAARSAETEQHVEENKP